MRKDQRKTMQSNRHQLPVGASSRCTDEQPQSVIGTRSFGSKEQQVAQYAKLMLQAISKEGITPVGKHFPGHGSTLEDSHLSLAVNPNDETAIWKTDLLPFENAYQISGSPGRPSLA